MADGLVKGKETWLYDFTMKGKRHCGDTGFPHKAKTYAKAFVEDLRSNLRREAQDLQRGIKADPTFTCQTLWEKWLAQHNGAHAERVKRDWVNHILPVLKDIKVMEVTTGKLEEIRTAYLAAPSLRNQQGKVAKQMEVKELKAKAKAERDKAKGKVVKTREVKERKPKARSNRGGNKLVGHISLVFGWGHKTELLPRVPFKPLAELVEQDGVKTFLTPEQVKPFLAHIDGRRNLHVMVAVRAMLYMGLREVEALHMQWTGFDAERKRFTAIETKTGNNIPLPVPDDLRELLAQLRETVPAECEWCLPGTYDSMEEFWNVHVAQFVTKAIKRAGAKMGITGLSPHRMRGSMATLMARSGANAFVIKKAGRWERMETAEKYVTIFDEDILEAQKKAFRF